MTVLTKFDATEKKDQLPLVNENTPNEEKIEVNDEAPPEDIQGFLILRKKHEGQMTRMCAFIMVFVLASTMAIMVTMELIHDVNKHTLHRYQGWCAIPYDSDNDLKLIEPHFRIMSVPHPISHNVEIFDDLPQSLRSEQAPDANYFKESFDIGDDFERITVTEHVDGRQAEILHDFNANISGIIDKQRCFVMPMNPSVVMQPNLFVSTIQGQSDFDVSLVYNVMRAMLPALSDLSDMGLIEQDCADRPTYRLKLQPEGTIRKRSADIPEYAKFTQFSGKHVQEIDIDNISELLAYEEKLANKI